MRIETRTDDRLRRVVVVRTGGVTRVHHPPCMTEPMRLALLDMLTPEERAHLSERVA